MLVVQVCILATLLRRLAEIHRSSTEPDAVTSVRDAAAASLGSLPQQPGAGTRGGAAAVAAAAPGRPPSAPVPAALNALSTATKLGLTMGTAFGLGSDAVLIFLASLLRSSPRCDVVLFSDQPLPKESMEALGIDVQRVVFESAANLPGAWSTFFHSSSRYWLFKSYLERSRAAEVYQYIQVSDVGDVAFQADPFVWVAHQASGLHVFEDEPGLLVSGDHVTLQSMVQCYGEQATGQIGRQNLVPAGYLIGTPREVQTYINNVVEQLQAHAPCQKEQVDEAIHNAVLRSPALENELHLHVHENRRGPVWTGAHVPRGNIKLDSGNFMINEDGYRYAVLHQYDQHEGLWRLLSERLLGARKKQLAALDCSTFEVAPGDLRGFDLSHAPADSEKDCCVACLGDSGCGSFVFKPSAKHCWLKRPGANVRIVTGPQNDIVAGILKRLLGK